MCEVQSEQFGSVLKLFFIFNDVLYPQKFKFETLLMGKESRTIIVDLY